MKKLFGSIFVVLGLFILIMTGLQSALGAFTGLAALAAGTVLLIVKSEAHQSLHPAKMAGEIGRLKADGDRIEVILDDCMISENSHSESVVRYKAHYKGEDRIFVSPAMPFSRKSLVYGFSLQESSFIYISKGDPSLYYFDLEFMFSQPALSS